MMYSDLNVKGSPFLIFNILDIRQSLMMIIGTVVGERLFNPEFGGTAPATLFELSDEYSAQRMLNDIYSSVLRWEPRVNMLFNQSTVEADLDNHIFHINLWFEVKGLLDAAPINIATSLVV